MFDLFGYVIAEAYGIIFVILYFDKGFLTQQGVEIIYKAHFIWITFYPTIQALCLCLIKFSSDPLSNVSSLSYLTLISIN